MGFVHGTEVDVRQLREFDWVLLKEIRYQAKERLFIAPADMETDFASVPRVFVWLIPSYGRYTQAAVLHDRLWQAYVPAGELDLRDADGIFRRAMRELGVPFLQRWVMWAAVRWGALPKGGWRQRSWWTELPRVLLVSLVVAPIVLPPAALVLVGISLFTLMEGILWAALALGRWVGRAAHIRASDKQLVPPKVLWKL